MADDAVWQPLVGELQRWRQAGRAADLWLRDDDAVEPTAALDRLLALAGRHSIPLTLAVIPAHAGEALAVRLSGEPLVYGRGAWLGASQPRASRREESRSSGRTGRRRRACRAFPGQGRHRSAVPGKQRADAGPALEPHRSEPRAAALPARLCGAVGLRQGKAPRRSAWSTRMSTSSTGRPARPAAIMPRWSASWSRNSAGGSLRGHPSRSASSPIISCTTRRPGLSSDDCSR